MNGQRVFAVLPLCLAVCAGVSSNVNAQTFAEKCKSWIEKKNDSTDYIESKTGKRQPSMAPQWTDNVELEAVQVGNVVFAYVFGDSKAQRPPARAGYPARLATEPAAQITR